MKSITGSHAVPLRYRVVGLLVAFAVVAAIGGTTSRSAQAVLPPLPNAVQQWNKIAEDTVVGSGAFQGEGEIYMSYASLAVYDAVVAIQGGYEPYGPAIDAPAGASVDAAVVEAAYRTLSAYFPSSCNPDAAVLPPDAQPEWPGDRTCEGERERRRPGGCEQHHRPSHGRWPPDTDRHDLVV